MKAALILVSATLAVLPACKSRPAEPQNYEQVRREAPDAKPTLYVAEEDQRYVAAPGTGDRQIHYYSKEEDRTYVVDEQTGKVIMTYKSKEMPGVVVVDKSVRVQTMPAAAPKEGCAPAEGCAEKPTEGCGEGSGQ
jgi:hypothetical protein